MFNVFTGEIPFIENKGAVKLTYKGINFLVYVNKIKVPLGYNPKYEGVISIAFEKNEVFEKHAAELNLTEIMTFNFKYTFRVEIYDIADLTQKEVVGKFEEKTRKIKLPYLNTGSIVGLMYMGLYQYFQIAKGSEIVFDLLKNQAYVNYILKDQFTDKTIGDFRDTELKVYHSA